METGCRQRHVNANVHDEFKSSAHVYYTVGVLAAGGALGTLGNVLVTYFFHSRRRTYPGRHFILVLAVLDLVTCLLVVPMIIHIELVQFPIHIFLCKLYHLLVNAQFLCVALVLMVAALDRLFYFHHPKKYSKKLFGVKVICFGMAPAVVGSAIIVFLSYCNLLYYDQTYNNTCYMYILNFSAQGIPWLFEKLLLILYVLPFVFVTIVYCKIYHTTRKEILLTRHKNNVHNRGRCSIEVENQECDTEVKSVAQDTTKVENVDDMNSKSNTAVTHRFCVITIVFWLVYLPAILIETDVVQYNTILFYMFLVHSVVKPLMYIRL